jgi:death-on-curing protein
VSASDEYLITFDAGFVVAVHDELLRTEPGLPGMAGGGTEALESALHRVADRSYYDGLDDIFGIAAMYAIAIARGHLFNDANKRTALVVALTYLQLQEITVRRNPELEEIMVQVAQGSIDLDQLAAIFAAFALGPYLPNPEHDTD